MAFIFPAIALVSLTIAILFTLKKSPFFTFIGILLTIYGGLKSLSLVMPPLPAQVVLMYMILSFFAFLVYFSIHDETLKAFFEPVRAILADDSKKILRVIIVYLTIPLLAAYST